jgi:hypothetical protein
MDQMPTDGFRDRPVWLIGVAALVVAQVGLGLALFSANRSWASVLDDRPILNGRHPLHQYHGVLGAASFHERGVATCYDPNFQAGYPKTPVFDGGSRPAELFLFLGGGKYRPGAYKLGLFAFLLLIPVAFVASARGCGLPTSAAVLSGIAGIVLGWSSTVQQMIVEGQLDLLGAGLAGLVFVPWLARYAQTLGVDAWLVLAGTATIGWYFQPLIWVGLAPVIFAHYLVFAPRHGPAWHLGLAGITFVGVAPNAWWLSDWAKYWWLRKPFPGDHIPPPDWRAVLGQPADYPPLFEHLPGGMALVFGGMIGIVLLWRTGHKSAGWLLLLSALFAVMMARVAGVWSAIPPAVPGRVMVLTAGFLVPPTVYAVWVLLRAVRSAVVVTVIALGGLLIVGWVDGSGQPLARTLGVATDPLQIGFSPEQQQLIELINNQTNPEARVLWDESFNNRPYWNWSALLPLYTKSSFLGGLDPESGVEHSYCAMCSRQLTGRALSDWSDAELGEFCQRYNVGWVMARSPAAIERWGKLAMAKPTARLAEDGQPVVFYTLNRPHSYILSGTATWESANTRRIILTNVVPNAQGEVELSLHMLEGLHVSPSYIRVTNFPDPSTRDPVDHAKLKVPYPVPCVMLWWENP